MFPTFEPLVFLDRQGGVTGFNALAADLFGWSASSVGQSLVNLLRPLEVDILNSQLEQACSGRRGETAELLLADGRVLALSVVPFPPGAAVQLREITLGHRVQQRSQALLDLTTQLAGTQSTQQVIQAIVERGAAVLAASTAAVFRLSDDRQTLQAMGAVGYTEEALARWQTLALSLQTPITDAVRTRCAVVLSAQEADRQYPLIASARLLSTRALVALPLIFGDRLLGGLTFSLPTDTVLTTDDQAFLHTLAQLCAQAFERAQLFEAQRSELTERRRAQEALLAERARLEAVLDQLPVAVWVAEVPGGRLIAGNQAIERMLRYPFQTADTIEGYHAYQGFHPDGRPYLAQDWPLARTVTSGESVVNEEIEMVRGDGTRGVVSFNSALIRTPEGTPLFAVVTGIDVTIRREMESQIRSWNTELEREVAERTAALLAANAELDAFSYSVSHDLRRPLRHITGFTGLLRDKVQAKLGPAELNLLGVVETASQAMNTMIDALLAFARLSGQNLKLDDINLEALVNEVQRHLGPDMQNRQIAWAVAPLPTVRADRTLLSFVLINLLGNAVKYTATREEAHIEVGAETCEDEVIIWVRDNGVGFNPRYQDRLFKVFQRLHSESHFEGIGIGLANVQRIISRHGGRVWAEGQVDQGATFGFSLPRRP